jgi:hypothetical protein
MTAGINFIKEGPHVGQRNTWQGTAHKCVGTYPFTTVLRCPPKIITHIVRESGLEEDSELRSIALVCKVLTPCTMSSPSAATIHLRSA